MKNIMIVHMLRLGDLIQSASFIYSIREKYPEARLSILINQDAKAAIPLMPYVDKFYIFERGKTQKLLNDKNQSIYSAYDSVKALIEQINSTAFDLLINCSHTLISAYFSKCIRAKEKIGAVKGNDSKTEFGSSWFQFLDHRASDPSVGEFHFNDVYFSALPKLKRQYKEGILPGRLSEKKSSYHSKVAVQFFTSDEKKNYPVDSYCEALKILHLMNPNIEFHLLGAPNEAEMLSELSKCELLGLNYKFQFLDLESTFHLIHDCDLLITPDTSIKHLAAYTKTPILEICLGSSNPFQTGAYRDGVIIVQSKESCAPCSHSSSCHRDNHYCSLSISSELIASIANAVLNESLHSIVILAKEYRDLVDIYKTAFTEDAYWTLLPFYMDKEKSYIRNRLNQSSMKMFLNQGTPSFDYDYGRESHFLYNSIKSYFSNESDFIQSVQRILQENESYAEVLSQCEKEISKIARNIGSENQEFSKSLENEYLEKILSLEFLNRLRSDLSEELLTEFQALRMIQMEILFQKHKVTIQKKINQAMMYEVKS